MRPSLSLIEESGRPSIVNFGKPEAVSASTRTRWASTPRTAAVNDVASIAHTSAPRGGAERTGHGRVSAPVEETRRRRQRSASAGRRGSGPDPEGNAVLFAEAAAD